MSPTLAARASPAALPNRRRKRATVPDEQRKRVRVACDPCRTNKLKCDGSNPCRRCYAADLSCVFAAPGLSREGGELHWRESLLESLLRQHGIDVPDTLEALEDRVDSPPQHNNRDWGYDLGQSMPGLQPSGSASRRRSAQESRLVVHHASIQRTHVQDEGQTHFDGPSSAWAFFDNVRETIDRDKSVPSPKGPVTVFRHSIPSPLDSNLADLRASAMAALPPQNVLNFLCSAFFKYFQSNYCFVHPAIFSRKLDAFLQGKNEFAPHGDSTRAHRAIDFTGLLFMVLAVGSQYADLEQEGERPSALPVSEFLSHPPSMDFSDITPPRPSMNPGWQFYQISKRLLSEIVSSSSITSIQACVLQGSFLVTTGAHDVAYSLYGLALRMAVNMGLHRAISPDDYDHLHPHVRELRNRLWWSVYTHERFFTFHMGRPLMIEEHEIDAPLPADLPDLQVNPHATTDSQIALVRLCRVMGSVVRALYSSNRLPGNRQVIDIEQYSELRAVLDQWEVDLPETLRISPETPRSTFHLHLTHKQGILLLSRIMLSHAVAPKDPDMPTDHQERIAKFLHDAARDCVSAALATIKILKMLRDRGLSCRFSYQDPLYCSAALHILLLGAKLEPPTEENKRIIIAGILILSELADGSENAASSLPILVQGFERFFEKKPLQATPSLGPENLGARASGYRVWRAWMQGNLYNTAGQNHSGRETGYAEVPSQSANTIHGSSPQPLGQLDIGDSITSEYFEQLEPTAWGGDNHATDEALNGSAMDQPFWLPGLDETFGAFGDEFMPASTTNELNLWDFTWGKPATEGFEP